jgi:hypothetical protein
VEFRGVAVPVRISSFLAQLFLTDPRSDFMDFETAPALSGTIRWRSSIDQSSGDGQRSLQSPVQHPQTLFVAASSVKTAASTSPLRCSELLSPLGR